VRLIRADGGTLSYEVHGHALFVERPRELVAAVLGFAALEEEVLCAR